MTTPDPPAGPPGNGHYRRPGWFTRNVFNKTVAGLTRAGISVLGSRVLEVKGRKSGQARRTPVNLLTWRAVTIWSRPGEKRTGCATFGPPTATWPCWSAGAATSASPPS